MIEISQERRPCLFGRIKKKGLFYGVFQKSYVIEPSPLVGGHPGGVVAYPVAVVEDVETGNIIYVNPEDIKFIDDVSKDYCFKDVRNPEESTNDQT